MARTYNCPNCAAPVTDAVCPYCGTVQVDLSVITVGKPCYLRINTPEGITVAVRCVFDALSLTMDIETAEYADGCGVCVNQVTRSVDYKLDMHAQVLPETN